MKNADVNNIKNDYSGGKKQTINSNIYRLDNLPNYPAAVAYNNLIVNEKPKEIRHRFIDLSNRTDHIDLMVLGDTHWGSMTANFMQSLNAQLIAKYIPNMYLGYNGDLRNNANETNNCVSSSLDNALNPTVEMKLLYELRKDLIVKEKTLFINTGNHENGKRNSEVGVDIDATFYSSPDSVNEKGYYDKYSRYTTLLTIRLKANNKNGFEDVVIYTDHGNSLAGPEGKQMDTSLKLASQYGARIGIFGHQHKDYQADYRIEKKNPLTNERYMDDLTIVELPAPMSREPYALDKRYEPAPSDIKIIHIGTRPNEYLNGSTQIERRSLSKSRIYCDVTPISQKLWDFGKDRAFEIQRFLKNKIDKINEIVKVQAQKTVTSLKKDVGKMIKEEENTL